MSILFVQLFRCNEYIYPYVVCVPTSTPLMQSFHCNEYIYPYVVCLPTSTPLMQSFHCSEYICSYACVCQHPHLLCMSFNDEYTCLYVVCVCPHQYLWHTCIRGTGKLSKKSSSYFLIFLSIPPYLFSLAMGCVCVFLPPRQTVSWAVATWDVQWKLTNLSLNWNQYNFTKLHTSEFLQMIERCSWSLKAVCSWKVWLQSHDFFYRLTFLCQSEPHRPFSPPKKQTK